MSDEMAQPTETLAPQVSDAVPHTPSTPGLHDQLPEDLAGSPTLSDFKDVAGLAKSYISAQHMIGNSVRIPGEDASPEQRAEFYNKLSSMPDVVKIPNPESPDEVAQFYNKLGRPETPDRYQFSAPEDVELDETRVSEFKSIAHSLGLTNAQADKLVQYELQKEAQQMQSFNEGRESAQTTLKQVWGEDYDNRLQGAKAAAKLYAEKYPDAMDELINGPSGNNPAFLSMLSELYGKLQEKGHANPGHGTIQYGTSPEDAKMKLDEIYSNRNHAYFDKTSTAHDSAVEYVNKLNNLVYGE